MNSTVLYSCSIVLSVLYHNGVDGFLMPMKKNTHYKRILCDVLREEGGEPCCDTDQNIENVSTFTITI